MTRIFRTAAFAASVLALGACSSAGGLGEILGGVLGGGGGGAQQLSGSVRSVDTRNQQISVQQSNGQSVPVLYDQNTKVVYQNRLYTVANLENGDQIVARIQATQNNAYYADSITVTQSVTTSTSNGSVGEAIQQLSGTVVSVDRNYGTFLIDAAILSALGYLGVGYQHGGAALHAHHGLDAVPAPLGGRDDVQQPPRRSVRATLWRVPQQHTRRASPVLLGFAGGSHGPLRHGRRRGPCSFRADPPGQVQQVIRQSRGKHGKVRCRRSSPIPSGRN